MGKIDIHLHLGSETVIRQLQRGVEGEKVTYSSGNTPHEEMMEMSGVIDMLPYLEKLGISGGILLSGGETLGYSSNDSVRQAAAMAPEVYKWMCNLDPDRPETVEKRLEQYRDQGAVGVGEFAINQWIGSPMIEAVFCGAQKLGMPVLFHMSPEEGFNYGIADHPGLPLLEGALKRYPDLKLIGHSQPFWHEISGDASHDRVARNSWGSGPVTAGGRLIQLLLNYPNLYCDLSANSGGNAVMRDEEFGLEFLEQFQDRLLFGTDMCSRKSFFPLGEWLDEKLKTGKLKQEVYKKICWENAEKMFGSWCC